ncbi:hypothetical protein LT493_08975 [Streptomyces tricolor]|nr:hypothetical protein [Streptomyces tricolor]
MAAGTCTGAHPGHRGTLRHPCARWPSRPGGGCTRRSPGSPGAVAAAHGATAGRPSRPATRSPPTTPPSPTSCCAPPPTRSAPGGGRPAGPARMTAEDFSYVLRAVPGALASSARCPPGRAPTRGAVRCTRPRATIDEDVIAMGIACEAAVAPGLPHRPRTGSGPGESAPGRDPVPVPGGRVPASGERAGGRAGRPRYRGR